MTTATRLLPHLPPSLQKDLDDDIVRSISSLDPTGRPLHLSGDTFSRVRSSLDVDTIAQIAARAGEPDLINQIANDRRVTVLDALATNPNLPSETARDLFRRAAAAAQVKDGKVRWQRLCDLATRIAQAEGPEPAVPLVRELAKIQRENATHRRSESVKSCIRLLSQMDSTTITQLIEDGTASMLTGTQPLLILQKARELNRDLPWGPEVTIAALRKDPSHGRPYSPRPGDSGLPDQDEIVEHISRNSNITDAWDVARRLHAVARDAGARAAAAVLERAGEGFETSGADNPPVGYLLFADMIREKSENGGTLTVGSHTVESIRNNRQIERGRQSIPTLIKQASYLRFTPAAIENIIEGPATPGADLFAALAANSPSTTPEMNERLKTVNFGDLLLGEWGATRDTAGTLADLLVATSDGDSRTLARKTVASADGNPQHSLRRRQIEELVGLMLRRRLISIAELVEEGDAAVIAMVANVVRAAEETSGRSRILKGDLSSIADEKLIELAAALLGTGLRTREAQPRLIRDRNLNREDIMVPAILKAGAIREALTGETGTRLDARSTKRLLEECAATSGWGREAAMHQILAAAAQILDLTGELVWIDILATRIPLRDLRAPQFGGEWYTRVEAEVLLHSAGDNPVVWRTIHRLADTWEGTAADLAATSAALNALT